MPTYVYETIPRDPKRKPRRFEVVQGIREPALTHDPETGDPVQRVITGGIGVIGCANKWAGDGGAGDDLDGIGADDGFGGEDVGDDDLGDMGGGLDDMDGGGVDDADDAL